MKLVLLGSTGYHPNRRRHTACFCLPELGVVLDAGSGMFRLREQLVTDELDIFLTHAHLDHVLGLTFLFDVLHGRTMRRTTVHAEPAKLAAVREHLFSPLIFPVLPPCEFREIAPVTPLAQGGKLTTFPLEHPGGTLGFRLDWPDRSMAYVTDTVARPDAPYVEQIRGVDLLVHECYFADEHAEWAVKTGHSWTTAVAETARAAGVGRLVLVHVNPLDDRDDPVGVDVARKIFPRCELGRDEMVVEF
ncbi:MAG: MBL fold metallo-hydrolase [Planctomycetaceae bacterium]|nr:MBL fold metallo-hydrolase [Planctomycetaceae bacterium]